jgi:hypothetical protein
VWARRRRSVGGAREEWKRERGEGEGESSGHAITVARREIDSQLAVARDCRELARKTRDFDQALEDVRAVAPYLSVKATEA